MKTKQAPKRKRGRQLRSTGIVSLLENALGSEARPIKVKMRDCQDVPNFLKKLDAVQKRTTKSKLHFGTVKAAQRPKLSERATKGIR